MSLNKEYWDNRQQMEQNPVLEEALEEEVTQEQEAPEASTDSSEDGQAEDKQEDRIEDFDWESYLQDASDYRPQLPKEEIERFDAEMHLTRPRSLIDHLLFQLEQFRAWLNDDAREAQVLVRDVIVFEGFQLQPGHVGAGEDFADGGIHLVEILGEDKSLHQGDVGTVGRVEREALRENFQQAFVGGSRVLHHRRIRLEQDVDGRDVVWLGIGGEGISSGQGDGAGQRSFEQEPTKILHGRVHCRFLSFY